MSDTTTQATASPVPGRRRVGFLQWLRDHVGLVVFTLFILVIVAGVSAAQGDVVEALDSLGIQKTNVLHIVLYIYVVSFPWFLSHCLPLLIWAIPSGFFFGYIAIPLVLSVLFYMTILQFYIGRYITRNWLELQDRYACLSCLPTFGAEPSKTTGAYTHPPVDSPSSPTTPPPHPNLELTHVSSNSSTTAAVQSDVAGEDDAPADVDTAPGMCTDFALYVTGLQGAFAENPRKMSFILMWLPILPSSTAFTLCGHYTDVSLLDFMIGSFPATTLVFAPPIFIAVQVSRLEDAFDVSRPENFAVSAASIVVVIVLLCVTSWLTRQEMKKIRARLSTRAVPATTSSRIEAV